MKKEEVDIENWLAKTLLEEIEKEYTDEQRAQIKENDRIILEELLKWKKENDKNKTS